MIFETTEKNLIEAKEAGLRNEPVDGESLAEMLYDVACVGLALLGRVRELSGADKHVDPESFPPGLTVAHPEVRWFAEHMDSALVANAHKPGWKGESVEYLMARLKEELAELEAELKVRPTPAAETAMMERDGRIVKEAADVANFAMMIADIQRESARGLGRS